jgi:hypothetical protein
MSDQIHRREVFRTSLPGIHGIPDPTQIYTTFEWYLLDSLAETLVRYDHDTGTFTPALARSWDFIGSKVHIRLREGLKFSDGSRLTSDDVVASLQRIIDLKQSTHFELWKYVGKLEAKADTVSFDYKGSPESLFLFLASPEASIWSRNDLKDKAFSPTRYSGFYMIEEISRSHMRLKRNLEALRSSMFPNAPPEVEIVSGLSRWQIYDKIKAKELDAFIGDYIPFSKILEPHPNIRFRESVPLVFIYALAMRASGPRPFDSKLMENIWRIQDANSKLSPAFSLLPPGMEGGLSKEETVKEIDLGKTSVDRRLSIGLLGTYFSEGFQQALKTAISESGLIPELHVLDLAGFFAAYEKPEEAPFDYLLAGYVASDKFPFAQLRLLTSSRKIEIEEPPEEWSSDRKLELLRGVQMNFLKEQLLIPLFFVPSLTTFQSDLDLGNQPTTDAELQFWRINERTPSS